MNFYLHHHIVIVPLPVQNDQKVCADTRDVHQFLLYLHRENIHAFEDQHIVRPTFEPLNPSVRAAAGALPGNHPGQILGAVANEGHAFFLQ